MVVRAARVLTGQCCRISGRRCGGATRSQQQAHQNYHHHAVPPSASLAPPLSRWLATLPASASPLSSSSSENWLLVRPAPARLTLARRREHGKLVRVAISAVSTRTFSGAHFNLLGGVRSSSPSVRSSSSRSGGDGGGDSCVGRQEGARLVEATATAAANLGDGGGGVRASRVVGGRWSGNRATTLGAVERGRWRGGRAASGSSGGRNSSGSSGRRVGGEEDGQAGDKMWRRRVSLRESSRVWTVPNVITVARICFCPVLAGLIVTSQHELALAGLLAASLTDWLDGYIARKWDQKSVLGGFLDPLADKIMVTTVALALGQEGIVPPALVAVMVGRDALLILGSLAHRYKTMKVGDSFFDPNSMHYKVTPSTLSKVNTVLQFGTLWLGLTNAVYLVPGDAIFSALCVGTGAATLASGVNYLLVSGLKPKGKIGKRLMVQRERLQERYRKREVLMRERMGVGRERMRARQGEFNDKLKARRRVVAGALKDRISRGRQGAAVTGAGAKSRFNKGD